MKRLILLFLLMPFMVAGQSPYKLNLKVDIPVTALGIGMTAYGFHKIESKSSTDTSIILALDPEDVWKINRPATKNYDPKAGDLSEFFFYGGFAYPFILLFDSEIRQDAGTIGLLYLETMAITGTNYAFVAGHYDKFRPYAYNPEAPLEKRANHGSLNSFPGGHPSVTAAATFFAAKVYSDYHPESNFKYFLYGTAAVTTAANVYLRYEGGYHFPTDLLVGVTAGTLTGILVPHLHKKRDPDSQVHLHPFTNGEASGLTLRWKM